MQFSSVQSLSPVWLLMTPWTAARQASLSITNSQSLFKLMSIELVMPSNHLILCCPFLLLPSIFPSIRVFSNKSALRIRWPKYWSFNFNISPSNEHPGLISFRMYWLDLPAVQGTLKSLLQHHSSKASIFRHSAFFIVQLSHPYTSVQVSIKMYRSLCMKLEKVKVLVTQSCLILCNPMNYSPPGSSVHRILQARIMEWVAIPFSRWSSWSRIKPGSPELQADPSHQGRESPHVYLNNLVTYRTIFYVWFPYKWHCLDPSWWNFYQ